ncbi:hypothetical protein HOY82DRAFT_602923 [Tuber indicum]|nr:hypothetical protein HOY82DRAFT_602923 [Tuber indicum]
MPAAMPTKKAGLMALHKYELCCLRAEHSQMKLADFALLSKWQRRPDGQALAISSLADHLKGWRKRIKAEPPAGNKQKERTSTYPFLEHFLTLWINAAEYAKVSVTDDNIRAQATIIQKELERIEVDKLYDGFKMSNGWLW